MSRSIHPIRRKAAELLLGALVLGGLAAIPAAPAQAMGCSLGPSIGAVAREAGISCPDDAGSTGSDPRWGAGGSACKFNFGGDNLPAGFLSWLDTSGKRYTEETVDLPDGKLSRNFTVDRSGKTTGSVSIITRPDRTFVMGINLYGRYGLRWEYAYFDCSTSSDGVMYEVDKTPMTAPGLMPVTGTGPVPSGILGSVQTRGTLTPADGGKFLMRVDLTNTSTVPNAPSIHFALPGYTIDGFPVISSQMTCAPNDGLSCSLAWIAPGSTVTTWIMLNPGGTGEPDVEVSVANLGMVKLSSSFGSSPRNHRTEVINFYTLQRS